MAIATVVLVSLSVAFVTQPSAEQRGAGPVAARQSLRLVTRGTIGQEVLEHGAISKRSCCVYLYT